MLKNSLEKFKDIDLDINLKIVKIRVPMSITQSKSYTDIWISLLEQELACNYKNYKLIINSDAYRRTTDVEIEFDSLSDATLFKIQNFT